MDESLKEESALSPVATDETQNIPQSISKDVRVDTHHDAPNQQSFQATIQNLTDQALQFLSTASNETIGACLAGLGATTYLVLGRVGLVLIGVVGGVALHAAWDGSIQGTTTAEAKAAEERRRKEIGLDIVKRVLTWQTSRQIEAAGSTNADEPSKVELVPGKKLDFSEFRPETAAALNELTDAVIRDYVK